jgi:parvulin-like peptidyl-prolyl isomerase
MSISIDLFFASYLYSPDFRNDGGSGRAWTNEIKEDFAVKNSGQTTGNGRSPDSWKWGAWGMTIVLAAGLGWGVHRWSGPESANAQTPGPKSGTSTGSAPSAGKGTSTAAKASAPATKAGGGASPATAAKGAASSSSASKSQAGAAASQKSAKSAAENEHNAPVAASQSTELKIVAVVDGEQITRQDLAKQCVNRYGKEVLETIINKHLILQACKKTNIIVTDKDVDDEISRIANKFGLSVERWLKLLAEERNISPQEYKREIIWPTLALRRLAHEQIEISDDEMKKAYESEYGPQVRVRLIAVRQREKAQQIHKQLKADPEKFESLAKDQSEDPSASVMGVVPPIRKHLGDPALEKAAFAMKPGQVSSVIEVGKEQGDSARQYVILKCEEQIEGRVLGGDQLSAAKMRLEDRLRDQKLRTVSADIFSQLQKESQLVNVFNDAALQKKHPGVAALINGQPISMKDLSEECIARHGATVLDGEIHRKMIEQELRRRNKKVEESDLYAEIARAADTFGYLKKDGQPDIDAWLKEITQRDGVTVELYTQDVVWPSAALKKLVGDDAQVNDEDLQKAFEANYGERVEVLAIVLANQRTAQQVWEEARSNPSEARFGDLANQFSVEAASRANFGKVPPIRRYGGQPLVEEHAFKLKAGELSPIIGVGDKFVILRCLGRTKPVIETMDDQVKQELTKDVSEKKLRLAMNQEFDRLKESTPYDNFLTNTTNASKLSRRDRTKSGGSVVPASANATQGSKTTK